jgi:hypothetical protein
MTWTSPRTTERFHECRDLSGFLHIGRVAGERCSLRGETRAPSFPFSCLCDRLAHRLGAGDPAPASDLVHVAQAVASEPDRERRG